MIQASRRAGLYKIAQILRVLPTGSGGIHALPVEWEGRIFHFASAQPGGKEHSMKKADSIVRLLLADIEGKTVLEKTYGVHAHHSGFIILLENSASRGNLVQNRKDNRD